MHVLPTRKLCRGFAGISTALLCIVVQIATGVIAKLVEKSVPYELRYLTFNQVVACSKSVILSTEKKVTELVTAPSLNVPRLTPANSSFEFAASSVSTSLK